jgi:hypothetical protein
LIASRRAFLRAAAPLSRSVSSPSPFSDIFNTTPGEMCLLPWTTPGNRPQIRQ